MSQLTEDLLELERIIAESERAGCGLPDLTLQKLGFKERQLTEAEKSEIGWLMDDFSVCHAKHQLNYEITILERHHDTSRVFQVRPDRINVIVKAQALSSFAWMER